MDLLIGIVLLAIGAALLFSGLRVFFFMLPIVGAVTGFYLGAAIIGNWLGQGFLATTMGWVVGLILAVIFAALSYLYWYVGALMAAGAAGALLLSGIFSAMGINSGILLTSFAIVGAVVFVLGALVLNLPVYIVLVNTAIYGAYMIIGGLMLLFTRKHYADFDWGVARQAVHDSWFWWIVLVVLVIVGIMSQMAKISEIRLPDDKWTKIETV